MAGTTIFTHTAYDMLLNYSRITTAVEKVELLWQQAFSKVHLQLRVLQLQMDAQQITEQMGALRKEKLQPYRIEMAKDAKRANALKLDFETCIYTPAMALVRRAEDVIHTLPEMFPRGEVRPREQWAEELEILKERFYSTVQLPYQTLRVVSDFYHYYDKAKAWYNLVLCENFLQDLLWGGNCEGFSSLHSSREPACGVPVWRQAVYAFLRRSPSPEMAELVQLAHLANIIPEPTLQQSGKQLSHRCMTLRKLLTSPGAVPLNDLQLALQWQYEFLRGSHQSTPVPDLSGNKESDQVLRLDAPGGACGLTSEPPVGSGLLLELTPPTLDSLSKWDSGKGVLHNQSTLLPPNTRTACALASGKPPSLSSFDSGFDGAGSSHLETGNGTVNGNIREALDGLLKLPVAPDPSRQKLPPPPQIHEENISSVSDSEDHQEAEFGIPGSPSSASIQIIPKITLDSLNFEIKVRRSSTLPKNPWLSLPVEDLENSYTVTITPSKQSNHGDLRTPASSESSSRSNSSSMSRDKPTQAEVETSRGSAEKKSRALFAQDSFDSTELSPVRGILSSTITEPDEQPSYVTEGVPTLIWDTYDFHNLRQDTCDGLSNSLSEVSLGDWAQREQEGLREVEEILDRAAGILEEEENVLAQEEMLDVLVQSESPHKQWALWEQEEEFSAISSSKLAESGVIGFEKDFSSLPSEKHNYQISYSSEKETRMFPLELDESQGLDESDLEGAQNSGSGLLQELQGLHDLEERILEENMKIHELRRQEVEDFPQEKTSRSSTERERFLKELEKEKREVEQMEQSLNKEMEKDRHKLKKCLSRTRRVVTCSIMERALRLEKEEKAVCEDPNLNSQGKEHALEEMTGLDTGAVGSSADETLLSSHSIPQNNSPGVPVDWFGDEVDPDPQSGSGSNGAEPADGGAPGCVMDELKGESHWDRDSSEVSEKNGKVGEFTGLENGVDCHVVDESGEGKASAVCDFSALQNGDEVEVVDEVEGGELAELLFPASPPDIGVFEPGCSTERTPVPKPRKSLCIDKSPLSKSEEQIIADPHEEDPSSAFIEPTPVSTPPQPKARTSQPSTTPLIHPDAIRHSSNNNNNNPISENEMAVSCTVEPSCGEADVPASPVQGPAVDLENQPTEQLDICEVSESSPVKGAVVDLQNQPTEHLDICGVSESSPVEGPAVDLKNQPTEHLDMCKVSEYSLELEHVEDMKASNELVEEVRNEDGAFNVHDGCSLSACPSSSTPISQVFDTPEREMSHFKVPIVLDTGSGLMKAGFADQDLPTTVFPTVIGVPKYEEVMNGSFERETYIGHDAQHMRGVLALKYPMKNGIIRNWDDMEMIWSHTFRQLGVEPEEHPVLLTEAALNPKENRQRMVELMFEAFGVPLTYVAMQAVLALYAAGRTTGVVFDSGDGVSHSVPVFEGYCLSHAVQRFTLAGVDVTQHLRKLLQEQGVSMCTSAEQEIVRDMKERHCYVALDYEAELARGGASSSPVYYTLPDGQAVCLSTERFRAPEILFKPELIGRDHYGMHESLFKSVLHSDIDLRRSFVGNIVLSGGTTLLAGLPERLQRELREMVPPDLAESVRVTSPKDRDFSVWSGGAVLANLPAFSAAWISQDEYEEFGPQIVFRKCF
ncbi:hypothetical protein ACEWY4_021695 [Coilia grayii]|uniref:Actin n=1 Tax=Coilia grayii TaxID=363190 RepID=A0ABD1J3V4_9TELE